VVVMVSRCVCVCMCVCVDRERGRGGVDDVISHRVSHWKILSSMDC